MLTSSLQSTPCATPDAANNMLNGMLQAAAGKGETIKVVSTDIREVDGMFIAVAFFEISQIDAKEESEDAVEPHEEKSETDRFKMNDDPAVALWHGLTKQQVDEISPGQDIPELKDTDAALVPPDAPLPVEDTSSSGDGSGAASAIGITSEIMVDDPLQAEFRKAEELVFVPGMGIDAPVASADITYEQRREEAEHEADEEELERLERLRAQAVALQPDLPTVDPAPPQG